MKKRFAFLMAVAMMLSLLVGCGSKGQDNSDGSSTQGTAGSVTLKLTHNAADGQAISDACIQLKNEIEEKTEGRVKIDIYGNNILGSETETRDMLLNGTVDMAAIGYGSLSSYSPVCDLLISMYIFQSTDEMMAIMKGDFGKKYFDDAFLSDLGIRVLDQWATVPRQTISTKPVHSVQDFHGLKVRIPTGIAIWQDSWEALGAMVVSQGLGDCFTSMQQGVIDAVEMSVDFIHSYKFQELAKYLTYTNHSMYTQVMMIRDDVWQRISEEDQKIMTEAIEKAGIACRERQEADEADLVADMEQNYGVEVTHLTDDQIAEMQSITKGLHEKYMSVWGQEAYDDLMSALDAYLSE